MLCGRRTCGRRRLFPQIGRVAHVAPHGFLQELLTLFGLHVVELALVVARRGVPQLGREAGLEIVARPDVVGEHRLGLQSRRDHVEFLCETDRRVERIGRALAVSRLGQPVVGVETLLGARAVGRQAAVGVADRNEIARNLEHQPPDLVARSVRTPVDRELRTDVQVDGRGLSDVGIEVAAEIDTVHADVGIPLAVGIGAVESVLVVVGARDEVPHARGAAADVDVDALVHDTGLSSSSTQFTFG